MRKQRQIDYTQKFVEFSVTKQVSKLVHRRLQSPSLKYSMAMGEGDQKAGR